MKTLVAALGVVILLSIVYLGILGQAGCFSGKEEIVVAEKTELVQVVEKMKPGMKMTVTRTGEKRDILKGTSVDATDRYVGLRMFSWFGLSPREVVAKKQGIQVAEHTIGVGQAKGYGVLETFWTRVKSLFWVILIGLAVLGIMAVLPFPAVSGVARSILRGLASIPPFLGSIVEKTISYFKVEKPLKQTVAGVQAAKEQMTQKDRELLKTELSKAQDVSTEKVIKAVKAK